MTHNYLRAISDPKSIITAIDVTARFPEILKLCQEKYAEDIARFKSLISTSRSSAELLSHIRSSSLAGDQRMALLKMFRRSVSPVIDTEMAKKINTHSTESIVQNLGHTFKPIATLQAQFANLSSDQEAALAALIGEYDKRGQLGYLLTAEFFDLFASIHDPDFSLQGPRGAGRDIELSTIFPQFMGSYPCDFVIRSVKDNKVRAVGFARYDSTRGGAQSDDRTGGNSDKVGKARDFFRTASDKFRLIFLADGPGLAHRDTWEEACKLDGAWDGNVRVVTLKLARERLTREWLLGT